MWKWILALLVPALCWGSPNQTATVTAAEDWMSVVRESPYWVSQGVYQNIVTIRRWVLTESGYCSESDRHILFGRRGRFLGYIDNGVSRMGTQHRLNEARTSLARRGKVHTWVAGGPDKTGYPFALACDQPHVELEQAIDRYLGTNASDRIWGTWDDLRFRTAEAPGALHDALRQVYHTRLSQNRLQLPRELPRYLAGQVLIESGARAQAHSAANARGILQLSRTALGDCGIAPNNYWHRLAQLDCALKLMNQNARNLRPAFDNRFGELPGAKRERLFTLLLIQAYHGGASRVEALLTSDELSAPAAYFSQHHERYTAGDIAFGMVYHNLGRDRLGLASLYYVADVELATEALCQRARARQDGFCDDAN
ncbi:MAG: hypothetical protein R3175_09380 [Marinobacter sp.]|uniref:hypothetical protein n=1 Tax=Marinobacter sp. TaxID=50741 RepID=UPI00299E02FD|nr:hypothetical protein [Marinobacter sp.]MDX1756257.1 hypothetical protein [Marinobacter sp.]